METEKQSIKGKMIDISNKNDILNPSTKGTDFLCQQYPLVCAVELQPFLWSTQKAGFLLEDVMPRGVYKRNSEMKTGKHNRTKEHIENWKKSVMSIFSSKKYRNRVSNSQKKLWQSENYRKRMSEAHLGHKWTEQQREIMKNKFKGKGNPAWRGGEILCRGYFYVYMPEHHFSTKDGYMKRSRLVMEKITGRYLKPEEVVHHINGIKTDDSDKNLMLFNSNGEHLKYTRGEKNGNNKDWIN